MPISLASAGFIEDVRDPVAGDSYSWSGIEPAAAKKSIVIHHSGVHSRNHEDAFSVANYHVNNNGWGGVGYHLVIRHDSHPKGAGVEYCGDLLTYRAHVLNNNPGRIGISLMGDLTQEKPGRNQLLLARRLIDFLLAPNNLMPSLNYYSQIIGHGMIAGQSTACPGYQAPWFHDWYDYLRSERPFPDHFYAAPAPAPQPVPVVVAPPAPPADNRPEWEKTWTPQIFPAKVVAVPSADVFSFPQNKVVKSLPGNELVKDIAGAFTVAGQLYYQTQYSASKGLFNGILATNLRDYVEPAKPVPGVGAIDGIQAPITQPPTTDLVNHVESPAPTASPLENESSVDVLAALHALGEWLLGILSSPLRLVGLINKLIKR
jgi:hypothetical protein